MECEYKEICPTTNFWVEEKKDFIKEVCNTEEHKKCTTRQDYIDLGITKDSEEWKKIVKYYIERKRQFPPYGLIEMP